MKHTNHEIDVQDLQDWLDDAELTYASDSYTRKKLVARASGGFKVTVAGETVWKGTRPFSAVKAYNAITEKYVDPLKDFTL